jgi:serine/threonine protein phosphatase PrpC
VAQEQDFKIKQLTKDHTPDEPRERQRILDSGGRIDSYRDRYGNPMGPNRVWLKSANEPGLCLTRSFGDAIAQSVGCNSRPDICEYNLKPDDKCLIVASDGIWTFMSNEDVASVIYPFYLKQDAEGAAEQLMRVANRTW